jgi:hypothetical protein
MYGSGQYGKDYPYMNRISVLAYVAHTGQICIKI